MSVEALVAHSSVRGFRLILGDPNPPPNSLSCLSFLPPPIILERPRYLGLIDDLTRLTNFLVYFYALFISRVSYFTAALRFIRDSSETVSFSLN